MTLSLYFKFTGCFNNNFNIVISKLNGDILKHYKTNRVEGTINFHKMDVLKSNGFLVKTFEGKLLMTQTEYSKLDRND